MELIYLYIRQYKNVFKETEINFSSNFTATYNNGYLEVEKNQNTIKDYYGKNVNNIVMFLGQNGMGKSTLLDILGMHRGDRIKDVRNNKGTNCSYFMLYHLYEEYFVFEFVDDSFLWGYWKIHNIEMKKQNIEYVSNKIAIGTIFKQENGNFIYCDNVIGTWRHNNKISTDLKYAYITSDRYNYRVGNDNIENNTDYMFERRYYFEEGKYEYKYRYYMIFKELDNQLSYEKSMFIKNNAKIEFYNEKREIEKYLDDRREELNSIFGLRDESDKFLGKQNRIKIEKVNDSKYMFLQKLYVELIEYYFLKELVGWNKNKKLKIEINNSIVVDKSVFEFIKAHTKWEEVYRIQTDDDTTSFFQKEYANLLYEIKRYKKVDGSFELKKILEYVLNRVQDAAKCVATIGDKEAILEFVNLIEKLPNEFFIDEREIGVICNLEEPDGKIIDLLRCYDKWMVNNERNETNRLSELINIEFPKTSEGEFVFLDIIAKCVNAVYEIGKEDSLVLLIDEPDRALHPELARKFVDILLNTLNKFEDRNIQIVLTSHSPFIVTDILPEGVYAIEMKNDSKTIENNKNTYATNIYYLLMDSFMLKNTFGEYSYKQIQKIIRSLDEDEIGEEKLNDIEKRINKIGEKTVKKKLQQLYNTHGSIKREIIEQLKEVNDKKKLEKIKGILEKDD